MSLSITRAQTVFHPGGYLCTSVGYLNPVWYKFLQYTAQWSSISDIGSGQVRLQLSSSTGVADLIVGGTIRFASANDGVYSGVNTGTIVAINLVGTNTVDLSGVTYRGTSTGGYWTNLTKYKNLRIETHIVDPDGNVLSKALSSWYAQPNHIGLIDLQTELRSLFYQHEKIPYTSALYKYVSAKEYVLEYRERYLDDLVLDISMGWVPIDEVILACPARKQIKEQYGNNLMDYTLKYPEIIGSGGVTNFTNPEFIASLTPWLKSTEDPTDLLNDWFWVSSNGGEASCDGVTNVLYQSVSVVAGSRRMQFRATTGAFFGVALQIWAFDNPATYLTSGGDLVHSVTLGTNDEVISDLNITFPTNRTYVGARFSSFSAGASGFKLSYLRFINEDGYTDAPPGKWLERQSEPSMWCLGPAGVKKPISFIAETNGVAVDTIDIIMEWMNINGDILSTQVLTHNPTTVGVFSFLLYDVPNTNSRSVKVWATESGDPLIILCQPTTYKLFQFCDPYVLLEYQNSLGGISHHAFMIKHNVNLQPAREKPVTSVYEYDIENSEGNLFKDGTDWKTELTMTDEQVLTKDIPWVAEIKTSKQVRVLFPNGAIIFCVVSSTDTQWITGTKLSKITVTVRLPDNFNPLILNPNLSL